MDGNVLKSIFPATDAYFASRQKTWEVADSPNVIILQDLFIPVTHVSFQAHLIAIENSKGTIGSRFIPIWINVSSEQFIFYSHCLYWKSCFMLYILVCGKVVVFKRTIYANNKAFPKKCRDKLTRENSNCPHAYFTMMFNMLILRLCYYYLHIHTNEMWKYSL